MQLFVFVVIGVCFSMLSCDAPGPLKAERDEGQLFGTSENDMIVVEGVLIVDEPMPVVVLRRTVSPERPFSEKATGVAGATVVIQTGDVLMEYKSDLQADGRYLPPDGVAVVAPGKTYELRAEIDGVVVRAITHTPARTRISELRLLNEELEVERLLMLFSANSDEVYQEGVNYLEYTTGVIEALIEFDGASSYQFALTNLENNSPLLINRDWVEDEDLARQIVSPLFRLEDGRVYLPWEGIYYAGRYMVKLFAVDANWFDLVRSDNLNADRDRGEAGQGFQRPIFHIENGIGLFASASVDSFSFFVQPEGQPDCRGCECWGCGNSMWNGEIGITGGTLTFTRDVLSGENCELTYAISTATTTEPCRQCNFAWEFTLGKVDVTIEEGGCEEVMGLEGIELRFAQGREVIADEKGSRDYSLYIGSDEGWEKVDGGWSTVPEDGELVGRWLFGFPNE